MVIERRHKSNSTIYWSSISFIGYIEEYNYVKKEIIVFHNVVLYCE